MPKADVNGICKHHEEACPPAIANQLTLMMTV